MRLDLETIDQLCGHGMSLDEQAMLARKHHGHCLFCHCDLGGGDCNHCIKAQAAIYMRPSVDVAPLHRPRRCSVHGYPLYQDLGNGDWCCFECDYAYARHCLESEAEEAAFLKDHPYRPDYDTRAEEAADAAAEAEIQAEAFLNAFLGDA